MKKIINLKEMLIILISLILIALSTNVLATDLVLGNNNSSTTISGTEYDNAQTIPEENNSVPTTINNNTTNNNLINNNTTNNVVNNAKTYNTSNNTSNLPQTGIEDYNVGILLIICIASAIFAYKKINDYKNI